MDARILCDAQLQQVPLGVEAWGGKVLIIRATCCDRGWLFIDRCMEKVAAEPKHPVLAISRDPSANNA